MTARVRTLIVGAGQAGLALSYCLTQVGHDHAILDGGRVAERWRSERWDSFSLLTPNWLTRLPGWRYAGPDPEGFMDRDQVVGFFEAYARSFAAPVQSGITVTAVDPATEGEGWLVRTTRGTWSADNVVLATGHYDRPAIPALAQALPTHIHQLHSRDYRNPHQLPLGAVLVVGAGPSGQQIADELARAGHPTYIAVGRHRPLPRRFRGRDVYDWMDRIGMLDRTVDTLPDVRASRRAPSVVLSGDGDDLNLRRLARHGVMPLGHLEAFDGARLHFAGDLATRLSEADNHPLRLATAVEEYVRRSGDPAPREDYRPPDLPTWALTAPRHLHLQAAGIQTVVWATGFRRDYSWVNAPVFDDEGEPVQQRGATAAPGLYFLGLRWMYRRSSNFIDGVGKDAAHLAELIDARERAGTAVA